MFRVVLALAGAVSVALVSAAFAQDQRPSVSSAAELHRRALAAVPAVRKGLDNQLNDYPSARFRGVQARLVRSVYADDEGQSDRVPWLHRGGLVLVFCGEINARNRMGGYGGWQPFAFQPAQVDIVDMYDFGTPRTLKPVNLAASDKLMMAESGPSDRERISLLCGATEDGVLVDPVDLSERVVHAG